MDTIKTFEDACAKLGIDAATAIPDFSNYPEKHRKGMIAHAKLVIIALALNDGWEPNWGDWNQYKYCPWFDFDRHSTAETGFGFSYYAWSYSHSATSVGSRLCFQTSELAEYAGKQFTDLYRDYMVM